MGAAVRCKHAKLRKVLEIIEYIESKANVFKLHPDIDCFVDGKILSVNANYRSCGIAGKLTASVFDYMHQKNIKLYHIVCSSLFSARMCQRLDFQLMYELPYVDYVVDGGNPLLPAKPHVAMRVFMKRI